jgi:hypothetical protein
MLKIPMDNENIKEIRVDLWEKMSGVTKERRHQKGKHSAANSSLLRTTYLTEFASTKIIEPKIPKKRVITTTDKWNFTPDELDPIQQLEYIRQIVNDASTTFLTRDVLYANSERNVDLCSLWSEDFDKVREVSDVGCLTKSEKPEDTSKTPYQFIKQQIQQKLGNYKCQDIKKNKYDELLFIKHHQVLQLMIQCENKCFYCKEFVHVLYENVREPKQWTLERIHNHIGHNEMNVVIACLQCNLRRRTMHHQRYVLTKQINIVKKI